MIANPPQRPRKTRPEDTQGVFRTCRRQLCRLCRPVQGRSKRRSWLLGGLAAKPAKGRRTKTDHTHREAHNGDGLGDDHRALSQQEDGTVETGSARDTGVDRMHRTLPCSQPAVYLSVGGEAEDQ